MKRGQPLRRVTPLVARRPLTTRSSLTAGAPAPRARKRQTTDERAAERQARSLVEQRSGGVCEAHLEDVCMVTGTDWHHRVNASQQGAWDAANGLFLCRTCHAWVTTNPNGAKRLGLAVHPATDPADAPCRIWVGGETGWWAVVRLDSDGGVTPLSADEAIEWAKQMAVQYGGGEQESAA